MKTKFLLFLCFLLFSSFVLLPLSFVNAAVPHLINYQGRLTDASGQPLTGSYPVTFRIYDGETAGNLLWEEAHTGIVIDRGLFSVLLGSVTNLNIPFDKPYFLEIVVSGEPLSPRQRMSAAAYAMRAEHGVPKGVIVMWAGRISDIPFGWVLCDGTNGTPDLRDRFIVGAKQDDGGVTKTNISGLLTQNGGSTTKNISHTHTYTEKTGVGVDGSIGGLGQGGESTHKHDYSGTTAADGSTAQDILPPYYALAFIMKST